GLLLVRFALLAHWIDAILGPIGSWNSLFAELGCLFLIGAVLPALALFFFIRVRGNHEAPPTSVEQPTLFERILPFGVAALGVLMLAGAAVPRTNAGSMDLASVARLPVVDGGRIKPLDTVARVYLRKISAREEFELSDKRMHPAIEWMMDVMSTNPR